MCGGLKDPLDPPAPAPQPHKYRHPEDEAFWHAERATPPDHPGWPPRPSPLADHLSHPTGRLLAVGCWLFLGRFIDRVEAVVKSAPLAAVHIPAPLCSALPWLLGGQGCGRGLVHQTRRRASGIWCRPALRATTRRARGLRACAAGPVCSPCAVYCVQREKGIPETRVFPSGQLSVLIPQLSVLRIPHSKQVAFLNVCATLNAR